MHHDMLQKGAKKKLLTSICKFYRSPTKATFLLQLKYLTIIFNITVNVYSSSSRFRRGKGGKLTIK